MPDILVDTGSMISTISLKTATSLNLPIQQCQRIEIEYDNTSTQWTDCTAKLEFSTADIPHIPAHAYVVDRQNEAIILGMD